MSNIIAETAIACAWPYKTSLSKAKYHGGSPYGKYKKAIKSTWKSKGYRHQTKVGCSCDVFVATVIRYSKADKKFPRFLEKQIPYLAKSKKWKKIGNSTSLKPGDVQIRGGGSGKAHIRIVVQVNKTKRVANAHYHAHGGTYGMIEGKASHSGFKTYRLKDKYLPKGSSSSSKKSSSSNGKTKPVDFYSVKEKITVSKTPELEQTKIVKKLISDWGKVNKIYPSIGKTVIRNLQSVNYMNSKVLLSNYKNILDQLKRRIFSTPIEVLKFGEKYIYFLSDDDYYPIILNYNDENSSDEHSYYIYPDKDTLSLYKEICLKYFALLCYNESVKNYRYVLGTEAYLQEIRPQLTLSYNNSLSEIYAVMNAYVEEHTEEFSNKDKLNEVNQEITNLQVDLNNTRQQILQNYPERDSCALELEKNRKLLQNLNEFKVNFKQNNFSDTYTFWNKSIIQEPNLLNFWLEFSNSNDMNNYVVRNIGRKAFSSNNENIRSIYYREIPNVIYYTDSDINKNKTGYVYLKVNNIDTMFKNSSQGISAKNVIDDLLYNHLYCTEELSLQIIPVHYLEPNTRILVYDERTHVNDEYIVNKISDPINYNGIMTINATRVSERLY